MSIPALTDFVSPKYIYWVCGSLLSVVTALFTLAGKNFYQQVEDAHKNLSSISTELTQQRTNCLATLQSQGEKQIGLLERIAESVSYLKGKNDSKD